MTNTLINTDYRTYLVRFKFQSTYCRFIVQGSGLMDCLKQYDQNGVESIKEFDPLKSTFKRISRADLLKAFKWETETYEYLKNHYFFK